MSIAEIKSRIKKTIDQFYSLRSKEYIKKSQEKFIGGVLQTALHLLNFTDYYEIKQYVYAQYGYDPGGVADGQIGFDDMET